MNHTEDQPCLDFDLSHSDLTEEEKTLLLSFLHKNGNAFAKDVSELGLTDLYKHTIDTGEATPIRKRFYRQSPTVLDAINKQLEKNAKT